MNKHQPSNLPDLRTIFSTLPDGRINRTKYHKLEDILVIATCAMLCGQEHFTLMETFGKKRREWLAGFLELPHGIPSHDTFRNVFAALDPALFLLLGNSIWRPGFIQPQGPGLEGVRVIDQRIVQIEFT